MDALHDNCHIEIESDHAQSAYCCPPAAFEQLMEGMFILLTCRAGI
jgi:hypothetical protein